MDALDLFVGVTVPDDRDAQTGSLGLLEDGKKLGGILGGRNQVDVEGTLILKPEDDVEQLIIADLSAVTQVADLVVLAVDAAEVAMGEEDGAAPAGESFALGRGDDSGSMRFITAQDGLFAKVERGQTDLEVGISSAGSFSLSAVCQTLSGADDTAGLVKKFCHLCRLKAEGKSVAASVIS